MAHDVRIRYITESAFDVEQFASEKDMVFFQNVGIDKKGFEFFRRASCASELHIRDKHIIKIIEHWHDPGIWDDQKEDYLTRIVHKCHIELPLDNWEERKPYFLIKSTTVRLKIP